MSKELFDQMDRENSDLNAKNKEWENDFITMATAFMKIASDFGIDLKNEDALKKISFTSLLPKITGKLMLGKIDFDFDPIMAIVQKHKHLIVANGQ